MRKNLLQRLGAVAAAAAAILAVSASTPAMAATSADASPLSYHSGSTGCFSWSWTDGSVTWTVYYHNTCSGKSGLEVRTGAFTTECIKASGGAKGNYVFYNKPLGFKSC